MLALIEAPPGWDELLLSIHLSCPTCGGGLPEIEPRSFSFNSPHGACPVCQGLGSHQAFQPDLAVPDRSRSWDQGAVVPWSLLSEEQGVDATVRDFLARHKIDGSHTTGIVAGGDLAVVLARRAGGTVPRAREPCSIEPTRRPPARASSRRSTRIARRSSARPAGAAGSGRRRARSGSRGGRSRS